MLNKVNIILKQYFKALTLSSFFALTSLTAFAADLQVNSAGILTGAKNVEVGSFLYDVEFVDGTGDSLFQGLFIFPTFELSTAASQALLDQVLVDVVNGGQYDSLPHMVAGCAINPYNCWTMTPYFLSYDPQRSVRPQLYVSLAINSPNYISDYVSFVLGYDPLTDTSAESGINYAVWSVAAVPEPDSYAMILMGLGFLGFVARRRKTQQV